MSARDVVYRGCVFSLEAKLGEALQNDEIQEEVNIALRAAGLSYPSKEVTKDTKLVARLQGDSVHFELFAATRRTIEELWRVADVNLTHALIVCRQERQKLMPLDSLVRALAERSTVNLVSLRRALRRKAVLEKDGDAQVLLLRGGDFRVMRSSDTRPKGATRIDPRKPFPLALLQYCRTLVQDQAGNAPARNGDGQTRKRKPPHGAVVFTH